MVFRIYNKIIDIVIIPIVIFLVYFLIMLPIGFVIMLFKSDFIEQKINKDIESYWIVCEKYIVKTESQF